VHAAVPTKIIVHYHRFDNAYSGWGLWLWPYEPDNGEGNTYAFNGDDLFGKYYETDLAGSPFEGSTSIGVIVKTGGWDKDVAIDRHIDITNPDETGTVHVYLVSGDSTIYYDDSAVDVSSRASSVEFSSTTSVEFSTSKAVTEDKVKLYADDLEVDIENFSMLGLTGTFDIVGGADLGKTYKLEIDFEDIGYDPKVYSVGFGGLYASDDFNAIYAYDGELGAIYSKGSTTFKIWAPISESISLNLYEYGHKANESDYSGQAGTDNPYDIVDLNYTTTGV
jgi:pullulanase